jgi:hypothetical protein
MTIMRKRAMSAVMGSGVAALSVAACPSANAMEGDFHAASKPRAVVRRERAKPRRGHVRTAKGDYVYKVTIGGEVNDTKANMACSGSSLKIGGVTTYPESRNAAALWERTPAAWRQHFTITSGPATTITVPYTTPAELTEGEAHGGNAPNSPSLTGTAPASRVCAAAAPNAGVASVGEGVATWQLPKPAKSVAALLSQPPTNINLNKLAMVFAIRPGGAVTVSGPFS